MTEETKKNIGMRSIILLLSSLCLIGLSASVTYTIVHARYQRQLDNKNLEVQTIQEHNKALTDENTELRNSLQKLEDESGKLEARLSEIEAQKTDQQASEQKDNAPLQMLVLKPTWVNSGETLPAFDGNLRIVLSKASDKDECPKDSAAVSYLTSDTGKTKLCLRVGKPEYFAYQGRDYSLNLSGIAGLAGVYRYCISISLEQ